MLNKITKAFNEGKKMKLKLKLTTEEIIEKFLPNLPPETGVAIEIEEAGAERMLPRVTTDGEKN